METFYRFFLSVFLKETSPGQLLEEIENVVADFTALSDDTDLTSFRDKVSSLKSSVMLAEFVSYSEKLCQKQDTLKFWYQFATVDVMAYMGLYLGIRYRNWHLRNSSIKQLAAIFAAFDRPIYQQLIPNHIRDILCLPDGVLKHLQVGGFSISLSATQWRSVAIDECHEMKINKDAKMAVVHPSATKI